MLVLVFVPILLKQRGEQDVFKTYLKFHWGWYVDKFYFPVLVKSWARTGGGCS